MFHLTLVDTSQVTESSASSSAETLVEASSALPATSAPAAATHVKPAAEIAEPTVSSTPSSTEETPVSPEGWGFASYFFFFALLGGIGFLLWWLGVTRFVTRLWNRNGAGKYRRVDDLEK